MEDALTDLIRESTKSRQELDKQMKEEKTVEDVFFETCVLRMKKLPATMQSFLQLQISQLFLNAENPQLPQLPITPLPLPPHQPQMNYFGSSAAQGQSDSRGGFFPQDGPPNPNTQHGSGAIYSTGQVNNSAQDMVYHQGTGDIVSNAINIANMMQ